MIRPEILEDRTVPAFVTQNGFDLTIELDTAGETLSLYSDSNSNIQFAVTGGTFVFAGGSPAPSSTFGFGPISAAVDIFITDSASSTAVIFADSGSFTNPARITATLDNPAALSVSSQNQSIVFPPLSPVVYFPGGTVVLGATASSGLPVAYTVVSGPGTVIGNVLTILGAGQIAIRADQVGDGTFAPAAPVTQTLEVIAATQTISFPAPPSVGFATGIFVDLAAMASSGLPIEYSIVSGPGFLNGNRLVATAPGTIVVRADQPGDAGFLPVSAEVSVEFRPVGQSAFPLVAVAGNAGGVTVRNASLVPVSTFESPGGDGAHAAIADFNGDGVADALIATGPGTATRVLVIDGVTGQTLLSLSPFESSFTGGASVAAADVNGDGIADIAVGADAFGGPRVAIFDGATGANLADFFGSDDASFRGGVRVALGDVNGDGLADLAVAAGIGGGPRIALWSGASLRSGSTPTRLVDDFFAFESTLRDGANVALGDVDGDGKADMIFSGGPGGAPRILVWNAADFLASNGESRTVLANFFAADEALTSGARVVAKNLDGDEIADLVIGIPTGSETSEIRAYLGKDLTPAGKPPVFEEVTVELGGVYVG